MSFDGTNAISEYFTSLEAFDEDIVPFTQLHRRGQSVVWMTPLFTAGIKGLTIMRTWQQMFMRAAGRISCYNNLISM